MTAENSIRLGPLCAWCCTCPTAEPPGIYMRLWADEKTGCHCHCTCGWEQLERSRKQAEPHKSPPLKTWPQPRKDWK